MACHSTLSLACLDILKAGLQALGVEGDTVVDFTTFPEAVPADPYWPHPPSVVLLQRLPTVSLEDLPRNITTCTICHVPYDIRHPNERPVALPCSHIVGSRCISQWFNPITGQNNSTCPECGQEFFPKSHEVSSDAGLGELYSMVEWVTQLTSLNDDEKRALKALQNEVGAHIADAEDTRYIWEEISATVILNANDPEREYVRGEHSRGYYSRCAVFEEDETAWAYEFEEEERVGYQENMRRLNRQVTPILIEGNEDAEMAPNGRQQLMDTSVVGSRNFPVVIDDGEDTGLNGGTRSNQQRISWSLDAGDEDSPIEIYDSEDEARWAADAARVDMARLMYD